MEKVKISKSAKLRKIENVYNRMQKKQNSIHGTVLAQKI